jgi:hypothetical protein
MGCDWSFAPTLKCVLLPFLQSLHQKSKPLKMLWTVVGIATIINGGLYGAREAQASRALLNFAVSTLKHSALLLAAIFFLGSLLLDFTSVNPETIGLHIAEADSKGLRYAAPLYVSCLHFLASFMGFIVTARMTKKAEKAEKAVRDSH